MQGLLGIAFAVAMFLTLVGPAQALAQSTADPRAVVDAFDAALNAGNVEATVALFAPDAVIRTQGRVYAGTGQIRALFTELVAQHIRFDSADHKVTGDTETHTATVSRDDWRNLGIAWLDASAEVVLQAGKIRTFTVTYTPDSLERLQAAQARAGGPRAQASPVPAQIPTALPRTGEVASPIGLLMTVGGGLVVAGLGLAVGRRTPGRGR